MKTLLFGALTAVALTSLAQAQVQFVPDPRKPLTLPRLLAGEAHAIAENIQSMQRSAGAFNQEMAQARAVYWQCHPKCPQQTTYEYARRLAAKDMWYLMRSNMGGAGGDMMGAAGSMDGGIHAECGRAFFEWTSIVAEGAGTMPGAPGVMNTFRLNQGMAHASSEYEKYANCRDATEHKRHASGALAKAPAASVKTEPKAEVAVTPDFRRGPPNRHALVCAPDYQYFTAEQRWLAPPAAQATFEGAQKRAIAQMLADPESELRKSMAQGALPVVNIGWHDGRDAPISIRNAATLRNWSCSNLGARQGVLARAGTAGALQTVPHAVTCWAERHKIGEQEAPDASRHYEALTPKVLALLRDPSGEARTLARDGRHPIVHVARPASTDPDITVDDAASPLERHRCSRIGYRTVLLPLD
jgi:hypothetical protein